MASRLPQLQRLQAELRSRRHDAEMTLEHVASRIGSTASQISRIERGEIESPSFVDVALLAQLYGISGNRLLELVGIRSGASDEGDIDPTLVRSMREIMDMPEDQRACLVESVNRMVIGYRTHVAA